MKVAPKTVTLLLLRSRLALGRGRGLLRSRLGSGLLGRGLSSLRLRLRGGCLFRHTILLTVKGGEIVKVPARIAAEHFNSITTAQQKNQRVLNALGPNVDAQLDALRSAGLDQRHDDQSCIAAAVPTGQCGKLKKYRLNGHFLQLPGKAMELRKGLVRRVLAVTTRFRTGCGAV